MKLREKKARLLVGLYLAAKADVSRYYRLDVIADDIALKRDAGELRTIATDMRDEGLANAAFTLGSGPEGGLNLRILGPGIELAEDILEEHPEYGAQPVEQAPAADRYVSLSDNQREPIVGELVQLRDAVRQSNDGDDEERAIALSEVAAFEAIITQPRTSSELIERFTNRILKWIVDKFTDAVVKLIAGSLLLKLLELLAA